MLEDFDFNAHLVLRTPALPLNTPVTKSSIISHLKQPFFAEALYLASNSLYHSCQKLISGEIKDVKEQNRVIASAANYLNRMRSRCTPFGLFAGCSVLSWGDSDKISFDKATFDRHTRLDMHYLCELAKCISNDPDFRDKIRYFPNSTLYHIGNEIRYVENISSLNQNYHQISSVTSSEAIEYIISASKQGLTIPELKNLLTGDDVTLKDAGDFIDELIEAQLIIGELEPRVTGNEFIFDIYHIIRRISLKSGSQKVRQHVNIIEEVIRLIKQLDHNRINNHELYYSIENCIKQLNAPISKSKLFQTDFIRSETNGNLSNCYQSHLLDAAYVLDKLTPLQKLKNLENFKEQFHKRYENRELPLNVVLDTEVGIGYTNVGKHGNNPLIEDLILPKPASDKKSIVRNRIDQYLYEKIRAAEIKNQQVIDLKLEEIEGFHKKSLPMPPSVAAMFRVVSKDEILVESITGSSAVNLLARFAHGDPGIDKIIKEITIKEQNTNPEIIFAEIVHLPQNRIGNILLRPVLHEYEIPYLAHSAVNSDFQIPVQDLQVSVRNDHIILRSKRLNKIIIPRLSTAHNYTYQSMPVYHFLCDLQLQNQQIGLAMDWNPDRFECKYLPRLTYKNVILALETWQFSHLDVAELVKSEIDNFYLFKQKWRLPDSFTLSEGDKELLIDVDNPLTIITFLNSIKKLRKITIKEHVISSEKSIVKDNANHGYANQFVALLSKKQASYTNQKTIQIQGHQVKREFPPGTEWVYFKIYCGVKSADKILMEAIKPLSELLLREKIIDRWFFIRYIDPDFHMRVRFHLNIFSSESLGTLTHLVNQYLSPYNYSGHFWKIQLETYQRELERYGTNTIEESEMVFFYDSINVLSVIQKLIQEGADSYRWLWGIKVVDNLLSVFSIPFEDKIEIISDLNENFSEEFNMDKQLKLQLDKKYRQYKNEIQTILNQTDNDSAANQIFIANEPLIDLGIILKKLDDNNELQIPLNHLMKSYIHMLVNRLMPARQRLYELMIYNFLSRQYKSKLAMSKI